MSSWVEKNKLGYVCPHDSPTELAAIIQRLRAERAELGAFARRVRQVFAADYTWEKMEKQWVADGAQADQVGLLVFLHLLPRDDVMDIQGTGLAAHGAAVSSLNHDRAVHRRWDGRSFRHGAVLSLSGIQYGPLAAE